MNVALEPYRLNVTFSNWREDIRLSSQADEQDGLSQHSRTRLQATREAKAKASAFIWDNCKASLTIIPVLGKAVTAKALDIVYKNWDQ